MYAGGGVAIADRKNPYMYRLRANDRLRAATAAEAVMGILKKKKIAIINVQDQYGTAAAEQTRKDLAAGGVEVVTVQTHGMRDTDFAPQLLNIKNSGAEALIAFAYIRDAGLMIKQRRALGLMVDAEQLDHRRNLERVGSDHRDAQVAAVFRHVDVTGRRDHDVVDAEQRRVSRALPRSRTGRMRCSVRSKAQMRSSPLVAKYTQRPSRQMPSPPSKTRSTVAAGASVGHRATRTDP